MRLLVLAGLILWGCRESEFKGALTDDAVAKTQSEPASEPVCEEEWTAEPPTRGEPKVPGPPYPHLNEDSKCGLHDKLRKFRWQVWEYEQAIEVEKKYLDHWLEWERERAQITIDGATHAWRNNPDMFFHCGDWGGDWKKIPHRFRSMPHHPLDWQSELQKLISQYERLHPTPGVPAHLSFGNEELVRSHGGEAITSYLAELETIVEEIAKSERANGEELRQIERRVLEAIDGCSPDMTLSICPHPSISWNISDGYCFKSLQQHE